MQSLSNYIIEKLAAGSTLFPKNQERKKMCFAIIKPGVNSKIYKNILESLIREKFEICGLKSKILTRSEAEGLYRSHQKESFYSDLCKYMASDISTGILLNYQGGHENQFEVLKKLKEQIRKKYKESEMRNVLHSSDSLESFKKESIYYFSSLCCNE